MNSFTSQPGSGKKAFVRTLHYIILFAMLHSTFVAPAQGLLEAWLHHRTVLKYKGFRGDAPPASRVDLPELQSNEPFAAIPSGKAVMPVKQYNATTPGVFKYGSDMAEGIIGVSKDKPIDNPFDNIFNISLDRLPQQGEKVYLTYELFGVSGYQSVARSINDRFSTGGYVVKLQQGWSTQKEELNAEWLKQGVNKVLFTIPKGAGYQYKVKNLSLQVEKDSDVKQLLVLHNQNTILTKDGKIYIKGFLRGNHQDVKVQAGNTLLDVTDNEFEGYVTLDQAAKDTGMIAVSAVGDSGFLGRELLFLNNLMEADKGFAIENKNAKGTKLFAAHTSNMLSIEGASIAVNDSALAADYVLSIARLRDIDIAPMESGMVNVTKGGKAYRFLPDGTTFSKPVNISVAYDTLLLPKGYTAKDIRTYYFDTNSKKWRQVQKDTIDTKTHVVTSTTTHFTDYINGIIQAPESPETSAFMPTMMNDIKAADPSAEITLISPPQASQEGDANISYPIKIPDGRNGMQPQLAIQYSNEGGNGWLGQGWSLSVPSLSIDTRWGVPAFNPQKETELYSLNGEMLVYPDGFMPHRHQNGAGSTLTTDLQARNTAGVKTFTPRKQGSFVKIERMGTTPQDYYWKVTNTDGTISWYGGKTAVSSAHVLKDLNSNIVHWALYMVEDVHGNNITYTYTTVTNGSYPLNIFLGKQIYLASINYTGYNATQGNYKVEFINSTGNKPDMTINTRLGIKQVEFKLLDEIRISYQNTVFRKYKLGYSEGRFSKQLLRYIAELDGSNNEFYRHTFDYYDDIDVDGTDVFFSASLEEQLCIDQPTPCDDNDGDGICNSEDLCPDLAGPGSNNGCPGLDNEGGCVSDIDNDGVCDGEDDCIDVPGPAYNNGCPQNGGNCTTDTDNDGICDMDDECVDVPGPAYNNGCPPTSACANDADGDGVCDEDDLCVNVYGLPSNNGCPDPDCTDTDGDGVCDELDNCVDTPGYADNFGCPIEDLTDTDNDGVIDSEDGCPTVAGYPQYDGCPDAGCTADTDGDGVCDNEDNCDTQPGPASNNGCPESSSCTTDSDGDGVCDGDDLCPSVPGTPANSGCPPANNCTTDTDGDGVCDSEDNCDTQPGPASNNGCPETTCTTDTDGDGVCDSEDNCDTEPGPAYNDGCPIPGGSPDSDGDGVVDAIDECPNMAGPPTNNGCPEEPGCDSDIDGDGICDSEDNCIDKPGTEFNHGCPDYYCYEINVDLPVEDQRYQYYFFGDMTTQPTGSCNFQPFRFKSLTLNGTTYTPSVNNTFATHFTNLAGITNLCPGYTITGPDPVIRNPNFETNVQTWLQSQIGTYLDANSNLTIHNNSAVTVSNGWLTTIFNCNFSFESDIQLASAAASFDLYNYVTSTYGIPHNFSINRKILDGNYVDTQVAFNGIGLSTTYYNLHDYFATFASAFESTYGGTIDIAYDPTYAESHSLNYGYNHHVVLKISNVTQPINTITIGGVTYNVTPCKPQSSNIIGGGESTPNLYVNPPTVLPGGYTVQLTGNTSDEDPECPSLLNLDFLIQGNLPSFNSAASFLGSSRTTGSSDGYSLGVGVGSKAWTKSTTFGKQFNTSSDKSESFSSMIDIDGDGLEDIVIKLGSSLYFSKHKIETSLDENGNTELEHTFLPYQPITGLNNFYKAKSSSASENFQVTFGFSRIGGFAGKDKSSTQSETNVYFTDANGDGLPDIVKNGEVYFNRLDSNGNPEFINDSEGSPNLVITAAPRDIEVPAEYYEAEFDIPNYDIVKVWEAPYTGYISISNDITLTDTTQEVKVTIEDRYKDVYDLPACLIKGYTLNSATPHIVDVVNTDIRSCGAWFNDGLLVNQGERIFFRVHANNNENPKIDWNPQVSYTSLYSPLQATDLTVVDENGLSPYRTSYSDGFMLSQKESLAIFPGSGTAQISWNNITVANPSDNVVFEIYKKVIATSANASFEGSGNETNTLIYKRTCLAGQTTLVSTGLNEVIGSSISSISITSNDAPGSNNNGTAFYFKVSSDSNVKWKQMEWKPQILCTTTESVMGFNATTEGNVVTTQTLYPVPDISLYRIYNRQPAPQLLPRKYVRLNMSQLTVNSGSSTLNILPLLTGIYSSGDHGTMKFVVKKNGALLGKKTITVNGSAVTLDSTTPISVGVAGNYEIEVGFYADDTRLEDGATSLLDKIYMTSSPIARIGYNGTSGPFHLIYDDDVNFYQRPPEFFGPMYRQWGQFAYDPDVVENAEVDPVYGPLINPDALDFEIDAAGIQSAVNYLEGLGENITDAQLEDFEQQNEDLYNNIPMLTLFPKRAASTGGYDEKWHGANLENYASAASYRTAGMFEALGQTTDPEDDVVQGVLETGAYSINKYSKGTSRNTAKGLSVEVVPDVVNVGASGSRSLDGYNNALTDYIDINGDRYPDIVSKDRVQYTISTGGLKAGIDSHSSIDGTTGGYLNRANNSNRGLSASGSFSSGEKKGGSTSGTGNEKPRFIGFRGNGGAGISGNFSKGDNDTARMWADVNGDGLSDILEKDSSGNINVRLNMGNAGYDVSQVNALSWGLVEMFNGKSKSYGGGIGINKWNGSVEAGISLGTGRNDVTTTLTDMNGDGIADLVQSDDNGISVKINKGTNFENSQVWSDYNLKEETESVTSALNWGVTFCVIIPIPFGLSIKFPAINVNGTLNSTTTNRTKKKISDFDGDGYPDLIEEISNNTVKVRYSRIRRTNMLKSVSNPLGGNFVVDYNVIRPTYDNPNPKWVLSTVTVNDGYNHVNDGVDVYKKYFEYEGGYYDRRERDFYGYEMVKTIDYNVDEEDEPTSIYRTSVSKFHNRSYFLNGYQKEAFVCKGADETQLFSKSVNNYQIKAIGDDGFMNPSSSLPLTYDVGGSEGRRSAVAVLAYTESYIYELGNSPLVNKVVFHYDERARIKKYEYKGNPTNTSDDYTADITYYTSSGLQAKNIYNVPQQIIVKDNIGQVKRERKTEDIDDNTGKIGTVSVKLNSSTWASTHMEYDQYGNLERITYPENDNQQAMFYHYTYDTTNHKFVTDIDDAYTNTSSAKYDYKFDKVIESTDTAGNKVTYTYDAFARMTIVRVPKEIEASKPYTIKFKYYPTYGELDNDFTCLDEGDFVPVAITSHYDEFHPSNDIQTYTFIDGLARPIQIKKDIELNNGSPQSPSYVEAMSISGKVKYDAFGRAIEQFHPYFEPKDCEANLSVHEYEAPFSSKVEYDEIDRALKTTDAEGSTSITEYSIDNDFFNTPTMKTKSITQQTGSVNIITEQCTDVNGRVTSTKNVLTTGTPADIWTRFSYNSVGELMSYTDAENISTNYVYDLVGRKIQIDHPDNGTTKYAYDDAGHLTSIQTANLAANTSLQPADRFIKYDYEYNRPTKITYPPTPGGANIANVTYGYGTTGNDKGRLIYQRDATGEQYYEYGNMGEVISNTRTVVGPNIPTRTFTTTFSYDSWNRIKGMIYPDGEEVAYNYNLGGNLIKIEGEIGNTPYEYIKQIDYDYYEQRTYQKYGNNTETSYSYTPALRRLSTLAVNTSMGDSMFNNNYTYDRAGNVTKIKNTAAPNPVNLMGGEYEHNYIYDNLNRLTDAGGYFAGDEDQEENNNTYYSDYSMNMVYNSTHGIKTKDMGHLVDWNYNPANTYTNEYTYMSGTHKVQSIEDINSSLIETYSYDLNGNIVNRSDTDSNSKDYYWDESNRLRVVDDQTAMQHYIYDAGGQRVLKASSQVESVYENGTLTGTSVTFDAYTTYPSAFIVVSPDGNYSKHYYSGSQRIVSRIGEETAEIFEESSGARLASPQQRDEKPLDEVALRNMQVNDLTQLLAKRSKAVPAFKAHEKEDEEQEEDNGTAMKTLEETTTNVEIPEQAPYRDIYFYHPDHLGSSTYLTDANGMPYQFFLNLPFGETMAEQHSLTEDYATPYKFNGKELDAETGLYYYVARYYDPKTSIWLSVDPLKTKFPNTNPYVYCYNNPIKFIDPNGKDPTPFEAALMAAHVYSGIGNLAGGWQQSALYGFNVSDNEEIGLKGAMYERIQENGVVEYAFVFAGTEELKLDGLNDLTQLLGMSDQYREAGLMATRMSQYVGNQKLTFIGHSLGGGLANYASLRTGRSSITFNPAWISEKTKKERQTYDLKKGNYRVNYVHESDPLNKIQVAGGKAVGLEQTGSQVEVDGGFFSNIITGHLMDTMVDRMKKNGQNTVHKGNKDDTIIVCPEN